MLRDPSLVPLSRQHQHGLALCVLVRRSLGADASAENIFRMARRIADQYELELASHFAVEEQVLFPAGASLPIIGQLIDEHRAMEELVGELRSAASPALVERFCSLLSAHIRREEGEFFEQIQRVLPREELDRLGAEIERRTVKVCFSADF